MKKLSWCVVLYSILLPGRVLAACHVITPSGSGSHSGADWNNAYKGFGTGAGQLSPSSMTRGDTYYLGAGSYGYVNFNTSDSGTTLITVKAPTSSDNCTNTGWNAGTMQGSAIFSSTGNEPALDVQSDYWTFDGQYGLGGTVAGGDITLSDYGIQANWGSGANTLAIIRLGLSGNPVTGITMRHIAKNGSNGAPNYDGSSTCEDGLVAYSGSSNLLFEYNFFENSGGAYNFAGVSNATVQYTMNMTNYSIGGCHGDHVNFPNGANNLTFRYNQWRSSSGTAVFDMPCGTCTTSSNVYFYGEQIYWVDSDQCRIPNGTLGACAVGDAIVWASSGEGVTGNFYFINNTIDNMSGTHFTGNSWTMPFNSSGTTWGTVLYEGNIISNSVAVTTPACGSGNTCTSYSWDHNAYYNTTNTADTDTNKQVFSSSPFVNESGLNFQLVADTTAGVSFSSPYNQDPNGNTRGADGTWDRGAFQFVSGLNPPTNLQATVN